MKVGDYVRTKNGIITKIIGNRKNPYGEETIFKLDKEISIYDLELNDIYLMTNPLAEDTTNEIDIHFGDEKIIKKSSPNIIDLIEVGDYVNGCLVTNKRASANERLSGHTKQIFILKQEGNYYDGHFEWLGEENIKSIVTREQFSQMEYKVKE